MVFKAVDARKILGLSSNFTARELKMAYYKKALLHHPDKNPDGEEEFKRINKAYELLQKGEGCGILNYNDMIKKFIFYVYPEWDEMFIDTTIKSIIRNLETFSYKIFNNISKERSVEIYKFLLLLPISDIIKERMREMLMRKMGNDNIVILNPSISDLLDDKLYKLEIQEEEIYIPLWHREMYYDLSHNSLIVQCIPDLGENVQIDKMNNIHYNLDICIEDIFDKTYIDIELGNKKYRIQSKELVITAFQTFVFKRQGILLIKDDIYCNHERADIIVYIKLMRTSRPSSCAAPASSSAEEEHPRQNPKNPS